jgi:hypothetical protein
MVSSRSYTSSVVEHVQNPDAGPFSVQGSGNQPGFPGSVDRDHPDATLARWIFIAITLTVMTRLVTWVLTLFLVGPVLGTASLTLMPVLGRTSPLFTEGFLVLLSTVVAMAIGIGVRSEPDRWQRQAHLFGVALVIDVVGYLASIPVALVLWGGLSNLVNSGPAFVPVFLVNLAVLWAGVTIARRAKAPRETLPARHF